MLEASNEEKDVGVIVSRSLKPSIQCARAAKKANQVLGQRSRAIPSTTIIFLSGAGGLNFVFSNIICSEN